MAAGSTTTRGSAWSTRTRGLVARAATAASAGTATGSRAPNLAIWPSAAFTFHIDETSPANGFLRVVPGSHLWATPAPYENVNNAPVPDGSPPSGGYTDTPPPYPMPLRFEKVPGEIPVYCDRGDVLLHDAYLWHSAARATDDETTRRHVRGSYFSGDKQGDGAARGIREERSPLAAMMGG